MSNPPLNGNPTPSANGTGNAKNKNGNVEEKLRERNKMLRDAEEKLASLNIDRPPACMAKVVAPGKIAAKEIMIQTNIFGLKLNVPDQPIFRYDVAIIGDIRDKRVEFVKRGKEDHIVTDRKNRCIAVFEKAIPKMSFYTPNTVFYYDAQSILFTLDKLQLKNPDQEALTIAGQEVSEDLAVFSHIHFIVTPCLDGFQAVLSDMKKPDKDLELKDRTATQFVDIATSMVPQIDGHDRFTVFKNGKIFPNNPEAERIPTQPLGEGKVLMCGATKAIRLIEGPKGRNNASAAIALDSLKAAFHMKQNLVVKTWDIISRGAKKEGPLSIDEVKMIRCQMRGLGVKTTHTKHPRKIEVSDVSTETSISKHIEMEIGGGKKNLTIEEYFKGKYNYVIKYPKLPLVCAKERGKINLYPMELLEVIPMQRVTIPQTTGQQSQQTTKACAVPPQERKDAIWAQFNLIGLGPNGGENRYLKAANMEVLPTPLQTKARILATPALVYGKQNSVHADAFAGKWKTDRTTFAIASECRSWALYVLLAPRQAFSQQDINKFGADYVAMCNQKGMKMGPPVECMVIVPEGQKSLEETVRARMKMAADHNCQFLFFISAEAHQFHKQIKLEERLSMIITQDLKLRTAQNYIQKNQRLTMENIVNKTNIKLGGLNYSVCMKHMTNGYDLFAPDRLFIGVGISHPAPAAGIETQYGRTTGPSVVGFAANTGNHPSEFMGDFLYTDARREELLNCMPDIIRTILRKFRGGDHSGGDMTKPPPKDIIIYRQGVAEGSYPMIIRTEVPLIRWALKSVGAENARITYIIVQKEHAVRLFQTQINKGDRAPQQNIGVGTVVDSVATHPNFKEFFLNSHSTLQGSARTPRYTVLVDDAAYNMDELELFTNGLAFNFQIVSSPVSIPAPLYIANRYSERGRDLFGARITDEHGSTDSTSSHDVEKLNRVLPYSATRLALTRINA